MKFKTLFVFLFMFSLGKAAEYYQATTQINIRSGPGKDFLIVGSIAKGDSVVIDSIISEWGQVIINNKLKGYASMEYLTSEFEY